jgi:hypothetical protein
MLRRTVLEGTFAEKNKQDWLGKKTNFREQTCFDGTDFERTDEQLKGKVAATC